MSAALEAQLNLGGARWWSVDVLQGFSDVESIAGDFGCLCWMGLVESLLMMVGLVDVRSASLGQGSRAKERARESRQ